MLLENAKHSASPAHSRRRALVVDDYVLGAQALARVLEVLGHDTRCAVRGRDAIHIAREFDPDLIVVDLHLPDINGFEVVHALRADARLAGSYVVAVSGWSRPEYLQRARISGFDHFILKPFDLEAIRHFVGAAEVRARCRGDRSASVPAKAVDLKGPSGRS